MPPASDMDQARARPTTDLRSPQSYRPEIDGLRAVAIIPVVLYHAGVPGFAGGFAGVDIFFVISGYLITRIIVGDLAKGRFSLAEFYERRARRILPAIFTVVSTSAIAAYLLFTPEDFRRFSQSVAATALFASNILFARGNDYFYSHEGFLPLIHMWSLAVEEQFYVGFPLLLMLLWAFKRRAIVPTIALVAIASLVLAVLVAPLWPVLAFYLLPTRIWELAAGALCALVAQRTGQQPVAALAGLVLIFAGFATIDETTAVPGLAMLLPVCGTVLVIVYAAPGSLCARLLSWRPLVALGLVSFGLYLWHQPIFAFLHYTWFGDLPVAYVAGALMASLMLAALSFRLVEQPVRQRRLLASRQSLVAVCLGASLALVALGAAGHFSLFQSHSAEQAVRLGAVGPADYRSPVSIPESGPLPFILYGDSHATQYHHALVERFGNGALLAMNGCLSAPGINNWPQGAHDAVQCQAHWQELVDLAGQRGVKTVIWAQRWERELYAAGSSVALDADGSRSQQALTAAIDRMLDALPATTDLVLMGNSPTAWAAGPALQQGYLRCLAYRNIVCRTSLPASEAEGAAVSRTLRAYAASRGRVHYVDAAGPLCTGGQCRILENGRLNYWDGSHMTLAAARRVVSEIDEGMVLPQEQKP